MAKLITLNTASIKKAVKMFTGLKVRVHKVRGQHGIRVVTGRISAEEKAKMDKFFADFNIVSCLFGETSTPKQTGYSYDRLFATEEEVIEEVSVKEKVKEYSIEAFWAGSASTSIMNDIKS